MFTIFGKLDAPFALVTASNYSGNPGISKKLQITLDEEATRKYLDWASANVATHFEADMEPCGCSIIIDIGGPYGSSAGCTRNGEYFEFGDADVDII